MRPFGTDGGAHFRGDHHDQEGSRLASHKMHTVCFEEYLTIKSVSSYIYDVVVR